MRVPRAIRIEVKQHVDVLEGSNGYNDETNCGDFITIVRLAY